MEKLEFKPNTLPKETKKIIKIIKVAPVIAGVIILCKMIKGGK